MRRRHQLNTNPAFPPGGREASNALSLPSRPDFAAGPKGRPLLSGADDEALIKAGGRFAMRTPHTIWRYGRVAVLLPAALLLCPDPARSDEPGARYELTLRNSNDGQNFSPPVIILHTGEYRLFEPGEPASAPLWLLAEDGVTAAFEDLHRMKCLLRRMLDETEFLSDYDVRALSRVHRDHPYVFHWAGQPIGVGYLPAESDSGLFGGNSNWRGPIWFPVNYPLIESLQKFHHYYGDDFKVECPTGSGNFLTIEEVAEELSRRLSRIFLRDEHGRRPVFGHYEKLQRDPHFRDYLLFYEYFHGDNGRGVGASHQTGWTGLIAKLLQPRRREQS
jgi:hypothetical protein